MGKHTIEKQAKDLYSAELKDRIKGALHPGARTGHVLMNKNNKKSVAGYLYIRFRYATQPQLTASWYRVFDRH